MESLTSLSGNQIIYLHKKNVLRQLIRSEIISSHLSNISIEKELIEIVNLIKKDTKIDNKNIFAVGYSNGGYWASFLAAKNYVNAGASYYGVWKWSRTFNGYPAKYFSEKSNPVLALIGMKDTIQKYKRNSAEISFIKKRSSKFKVHF